MVGLSVGPLSQLCRCAEGFGLEQFLSWEILGFPDDLRPAAVPDSADPSANCRMKLTPCGPVVGTIARL